MPPLTLSVSLPLSLSSFHQFHVVRQEINDALSSLFSALSYAFFIYLFPLCGGGVSRAGEQHACFGDLVLTEVLVDEDYP
ncbi:hypothetical protein BVRB_7g164030 [Beta vulgaris subsp. vulgaris]|nr:hypothetical protein BVRB_7g164030 [Beta vulgaris subsp. vulgaris]